VSEWISAKDQEPPYDQAIAVLREGQKVAQLGYRRSFLARNRNAFEWIFNGAPTRRGDVAYWMPLPEPPK
jgi:hypothetical protein